MKSKVMKYYQFIEEISDEKESLKRFLIKRFF
jgi:hypothetical protein